MVMVLVLQKSISALASLGNFLTMIADFINFTVGEAMMALNHNQACLVKLHYKLCKKLGIGLPYFLSSNMRASEKQTTQPPTSHPKLSIDRMFSFELS